MSDSTPVVSENLTEPKPIPPTKRNTFAALKHPNYRLWFQGQIVSLFGTWMQATAQGFLVYQLTHSPAYLGYVGFAAGAPSWILTLYGGVVADRVSKRNLLIVTQSLMMSFALILAALTFLNVVQAWHIVGLSFLLGVANAFDAPTRQAFVTELVPHEDLTNAIALNATMFNAALAAGPAIAGIAYAALGPEWCFLINGITFIAVIVALTKMTLNPAEKAPRRQSTWVELKEGLRHVVTHAVIRAIFLVIAVNQLFIISLATIFPAWSVSVLHGDAATNGLLYSLRGIGSLVGALGIAYLGRISFRGRLLTVGMVASALLTIFFALFDWLPMSLILLFGIGMGTIMVMNLANAMVQTLTPERLRGRVMGAYTWIFFGTMPLGALMIGSVSHYVGLANTIAINGAVALVLALASRVLFPKLSEQ